MVERSDMTAMLCGIMLRTLDEFAYCFGEEEQYEGEFQNPTALDDGLCATVEYRSGKIVESVSLTAPWDLCREMATGVLGVDAEALPPDAEPDVLKEWANIVAGTLATERFGPDAEVSIGSPAIERIAAGDDRLSTPDVVRLGVDGYVVLGRILPAPVASQGAVS